VRKAGFFGEITKMFLVLAGIKRWIEWMVKVNQSASNEAHEKMASSQTLGNYG